MNTTTAIVLVAGVGIVGYLLISAGKAGNPAQVKETSTGDKLTSILGQLAGGFGKGLGDWYGSGYNSDEGPWAKQTSWYGSGDYGYPN